MTQISDEGGFAILQVPNVEQIPTTITVRGIARHVGTTSIATNLAVMLARGGSKVLLLDLSLWNCDLTYAFGHASDPALIKLAEEFENTAALQMDSIESSIRSCRPNLDLLPGVESWLESPALRAENGWNFIDTLLVKAKGRWNTVIADLGSHTPTFASRDITFLTLCAVHASILQVSHHIIGVCDSINYLKLWQEHPSEDSHLRDKTLYVVNQHRQDLPLGLDRYTVNQTVRTQSVFIPSIQDGLLINNEGLFFVERGTKVGQATKDEIDALHKLKDLLKLYNGPML